VPGVAKKSRDRLPCLAIGTRRVSATPEHLAKIGVPVVHELRGVGKNVQDHYVARVSYPIVGAQTANERSRGLPLAGEVMRWLFTGKGMLTYSPSIVAASVKVLEESATPDMQVTFAPGSFKGGQIGELEETPGLSAGAWQMRLLSRGYVEARSNRPGDMPAINPRYLSEEADRRAVIGGLRFARKMFAAPALKQFVREESLPGPRSRATTNCSITRAATAAPAITRAAPV
jgi:choline dehydrogenase